MYKLGLVSISFRKHSPEEIILAAKKAGLECIEWGSDVHAPCNDTEKLNSIAALQKEHGIYCSSYGTYFRLGVSEIEELPQYITAAKTLGTDILRLWCGDKAYAEYTEKEKELLFAECRKAAEIAETENVTLCMECHNHTFTDEIEAALELMKAVDSPYFRMYWQPNQFKTVQQNMNYAENISEYARHVHVFNWSGDERYPLEESIEIWQKYLDNFKGERALLLEFMPDDDIETLSREAQALRRITENI